MGKDSGRSEPSAPATPTPPKAKRKLSAARKAAIVAVLKKRWAAKKAATAKPEAICQKDGGEEGSSEDGKQECVGQEIGGEENSSDYCTGCAADCD